MDLVMYGQLYNDAMSGMDMFFDDMKYSMKNFSKKKYPALFEEMKKKYGKVFLCIEEIYNYETDKENWLRKLAERFTGYAEDMIQSKKWKFQREGLLIDCNMYVICYITPAILEYKGNMSEPFAQAIVDCWNETFGTKMECGNYDRIANGFSTSILGIPLGK